MKLPSQNSGMGTSSALSWYKERGRPGAETIKDCPRTFSDCPRFSTPLKGLEMTGTY